MHQTWGHSGRWLVCWKPGSPGLSNLAGPLLDSLATVAEARSSPHCASTFPHEAALPTRCCRSRALPLDQDNLTFVLVSKSKRKRRSPWERWSPSTSVRQASRWATPAGGCATLLQSVPPSCNMRHPVATCATLLQYVPHCCNMCHPVASCATLLQFFL